MDEHGFALGIEPLFEPEMACAREWRVAKARAEESRKCHLMNVWIVFSFRRQNKRSFSTPF